MFGTKFIINKVVDHSELPQIVAIVISCIPSFITGLIIAWPSPSIPKIVNDKGNYDITEEEASYFSFLNATGPVLLSVFISKLCDTLGRKKTLMLSAIPHAITWIMKAFCTNINALYAARALGSLGDTFMYNSLPMYIGEVCTPRVRGVWGNGLICALYLGLFTINTIGAYCSIKLTALICLVFPIVFFILFYFMPESPYYYTIKGNDEAAKESLKWLRGSDNIEEEFAKLKDNVNKQMAEPSSWKDVLTVESNRKACLAGVFLRVSQNFCGLLAFSVYAQYIFENAGDIIDPKVSSILYTGLSFLCYIIASNFSDKLGRRLSYITSISLTTIPLFVIAIYFVIKEYAPQLHITNYDFLPLVCMIVYIILASFGTGLVPTLMLGELFAANVKVKSLSIVTTFFSLSFCAANNLFYYISKYCGIFGPFFIFGGCNIVSAIAAAVIIPETRGKTLEEIQHQLKKKGQNSNAT
ncbi:unnamed protein product [Diabrotica balteata]|uniref:Facilitated trehalose transporter Tret1-like n=1 Tax=Diabrotica balteata TaxID=107213 RepID=A0A9N9T1B7_DIABA|nr:unnamed protein product [Diabrotica balteata]